MAMGHARRPARNWPMPKLYHRPACRHACQLRPQASARARGNFLKIGYFAPFIMCNFYTLRVEIFHVFFYPFTSTYDPYELKSFMEIGLHVFQKSGRQTHTQTQQLYIYRYWSCLCTVSIPYIRCMLVNILHLLLCIGTVSSVLCWNICTCM